MAFLDNTGLERLWQHIVAKLGDKVNKESGKGLSTNDYTDVEKNKLAGIAEGANKTVVDSTLSSSSTNPVQNKVVNAAISNLNTLVGDTSVSEQITTAASTKADASHTHDNRYYTETEIDSKLSGKSDTSHTHSAYVNQNAFSNIKVGNTTVAADTATDTVTLVAGNNITLTPDATNDKITIAATDTVYTHPSSGVTAGTYKSVTVNAQGHVTAGSNPTTLSGYGITDAAAKSHSHNNATTSAAGFMSATDKSTLDSLSGLVGDTSVSAQIAEAIADKVDKVSGKQLSTNDYTTTEKNKLANIASGAEVNQNAFSNIAVGTTTIAADAKTDTLTIAAGNNVTITPDATNDKITIAATDTVYTHPTYTSKGSGLYKVAVDGTGHVSGATAVVKSDITALGIPAQDTTYSAATTSAAGLMSASDKSKLDGIATGANKITVDSSLSSTSTNPVQNKVINAAISNLNTLVGDTSVASQISTAIADKADADHTHTAADVGADASGAAASALSSAKSYTDTKISNLINGAPTTLDTLGEIAAAMEDNADVVEALETAVGTKANASDLTSHTGNKSNPHGVTVSQIGAVPTSRTVNGKALSANITLAASDVGADASGAASSALTSAKAYTDSEIAEWVGDATVSEQISTAVAAKADTGHTHSNYASTVSTTGTGNAITAISQSGNTITATKGSTFLTAHPTISKSTDSTSTASPAHGGTFTAVDSITRDSNGHVTKVNTKTITLPADNNTDTKVTQTVTTSNASYPLLLAPSGQKATTTTTSYFDSGVTLNPSTNTIAANIDGSAAKATSDGAGNNIVNTYATKTALSAVETLVGDTAVATQISEAIASKSDVGHTHSSYVNQNAFSNIVVGSTTVAADSATDTLTLVAGNNVTITPDATNDKITIAATDTVYTHPSYTARTGVPTANQTPAFGGTFTVSQPVSDSTGHITAINSRTITIPNATATTSAAGLMSSSDKTKLDGVAAGANKTVVDSALSTTSTNPVQNKVVATSINNLNTLVGDAAVATQISDAISGSMSGNAATATQLETERTLSWTGDATGSMSFDGSVDASAALTLKSSGVTAGSYGPSANASPAHNGTFDVPYITVDAKGRVTSASTKTITLPSDNNTDTKVTNTLATTTKAYITGTTSSTTNTGTQVFDTGVYLDTTAGTLTATTFKGALSGNAASATKATQDASGNVITSTYATKSELNDVSNLVGDTAVASQIANAVASKADAGHTHNYAGSSSAGGAAKVSESDKGIVTTGSGTAYTATVSGITSLTAGVSFVMIPHTNSTTTAPTLNVNGLGEKSIKRRLSNLSTGVQAGYTTGWLVANLPFRVTYDGTQWIVEGMEKPAAADLYGTLSVAKGGTGATDAATARNNLGAAAASHFHDYSSGGTNATTQHQAQINMLNPQNLSEGTNILTLKPGIYGGANNSTTADNYPEDIWSPMVYVLGYQNSDTADDGYPTGAWNIIVQDWQGRVWTRRRQWSTWGDWQRGFYTNADNSMTGVLTINNNNSSAGYVKLWEDNEGGNIEIGSPNGKAYQMDAFNENFRLYTNNGVLSWAFNGETGGFHTRGLISTVPANNVGLQIKAENITNGNSLVMGPNEDNSYFYALRDSSDGTLFYINLYSDHIVFNGGGLPINSGGTGATDTSTARSNLGVMKFGTYDNGNAESYANKYSYWVTYKKDGVDINQMDLRENSTTFAKPVEVGSGGTGASDAATARSNLGITPANIGALPTTGGNMTGYINFDQSNAGLVWYTANGTRFRWRPYSPNNIFQMTVTPSGGSEFGALNMDTSGNISLSSSLTIAGKTAYHMGNIVYSSTQPTGSTGMIWLKPV